MFYFVSFVYLVIMMFVLFFVNIFHISNGNDKKFIISFKLFIAVIIIITIFIFIFKNQILEFEAFLYE